MLIDELVPRFTIDVDNLFAGCEDAVGEPVVVDELPDVLDRVEFRAFGQEYGNADVAGDIELAGHVPTGLIHQHNRVGIRRDGERYLGQLQQHAIGIAKGWTSPVPWPCPGQIGPKI